MHKPLLHWAQTCVLQALRTLASWTEIPPQVTVGWGDLQWPRKIVQAVCATV